MKLKRTLYFIIITAAISLTGCDNRVSNDIRLTRLEISTANKYGSTVTAGSLVATAMAETNGIDIVLYPSRYLESDVSATISTGMTENDIKNNIYPLYDNYSTTYKTGYMSGENIKRFIYERCMQNAICDLQVAGISFDIIVQGGICQIYSITLADGSRLDEDRYYSVAVNDNLFYPTYQWYNNLEYDFYESISSSNSNSIDSLESLKQYLQSARSFEQLTTFRSRVLNIEGEDLSGTDLPICEIQGTGHLSSYRGKRVTVRGIVTAWGNVSDGADQGARIFYIQTPDSEADDDDRTSNALFGYMTAEEKQKYGGVLTVGNLVRLTGVISEDYTEGGMTRTSIRFFSDSEIISINQNLPAAIRLGEGGDRRPPTGRISTFVGNIHTKESLVLTDGIDFWESLEGMRCTLLAPTLTGFYGGNAYNPFDTKTYISLNVALKGYETTSAKQLTPEGGLVIDFETDDYNPEIIEIVDNFLWPNVWNGSDNPGNCTFAVGDAFGTDIEGILAFAPSFFGEGEYVFYSSTAFGSGTSGKVDLDKRDPTVLKPDTDHLTVVTYNILNLGGDDADDDQGKLVAESIVTCLHLPDIICLVEVQDNNGPGSSGGTKADKTLEKLIEQIELAITNKGVADTVTYKYLNIDPELNADGGEQGGNIRVAFLYNSERVGFERRGNAGATDETEVDSSGSIILNPGRVATGNDAFYGGRKSLAAEFTFNGEKITLIGNHLKSKLGDTPLWGADQPVILETEVKRTAQAQAIHNFVARVLKYNSSAKVVVLGDFNEFYAARPMQILAGDILKNLAVEKLGFNERYSYNYNGNSQMIDHIYVSKPLLDCAPEIDPVHINSNYMFRTSDHDPVLARFYIPAK